MTDRIVGTESSICFSDGKSYYGSSRIDEVSKEIDVMDMCDRWMAESIDIEFTFGGIVAEEIIGELEEDVENNVENDETVNFVEENSLLVGY